MIRKLLDTLYWLPSYYLKRIQDSQKAVGNDRHIFFCICDHFEPYWKNSERSIAVARIKSWIDNYPKIASNYVDSDGRILKYSFFYPEEEYLYEDMESLALLCRNGFGEVEIHLHHDNDNEENLRRTIKDFKNRLYHDHGLLSIDKANNEIVYGFIHGNWALDNSRPDGRRCGVNNEIDILLETGCYADFTMPSAPSNTQTRKVNSIYYAIDDPVQPKSHNSGQNAVVGIKNNGLLMIQGPLSPNWNNRKYGILPRIENGGLMPNSPPTAKRIQSWIEANIHVDGFPEGIFVKIYTHGTQEGNMKMLFDNGGLDQLFIGFENYRVRDKNVKIHFVSAREMANIALAIENGVKDDFDSVRDFRYVRS